MFQLCEIDLSEVLPPDALLPFMDEIKKREKHRKQVARKVSLPSFFFFFFFINCTQGGNDGCCLLFYNRINFCPLLNED